jgi:hypothetical protein
MRFEDKYFTKIVFNREQIRRNYNNALRDLNIAKTDKILEVKFNYAYTALIKAGISLLSYYDIKVRSVPGHHIKIIDKLAKMLRNETVADMANVMRAKRNLDLYAGGIEITQKECKEYIKFVEGILKKVKAIIEK